jgi:hypothetical protein
MARFISECVDPYSEDIYSEPGVVHVTSEDPVYGHISVDVIPPSQLVVHVDDQRADLRKTTTDAMVASVARAISRNARFVLSAQKDGKPPKDCAKPSQHVDRHAPRRAQSLEIGSPGSSLRPGSTTHHANANGQPFGPGVASKPPDISTSFFAADEEEAKKIAQQETSSGRLARRAGVAVATSKRAPKGYQALHGRPWPAELLPYFFSSR